MAFRTTLTGKEALDKGEQFYRVLNYCCLSMADFPFQIGGHGTHTPF